jgi:hypothetical protein
MVCSYCSAVFENHNIDCAQKAEYCKFQDVAKFAKFNTLYYFPTSFAAFNPEKYHGIDQQVKACYFYGLGVF